MHLARTGDPPSGHGHALLEHRCLRRMSLAGLRRGADWRGKDTFPAVIQDVQGERTGSEAVLTLPMHAFLFQTGRLPAGGVLECVA